jgi:hypothetical protein
VHGLGRLVGIAIDERLGEYRSADIDGHLCVDVYRLRQYERASVDDRGRSRSPTAADVIDYCDARNGYFRRQHDVELVNDQRNFMHGIERLEWNETGQRIRNDCDIDCQQHIYAHVFGRGQRKYSSFGDGDRDCAAAPSRTQCEYHRQSDVCRLWKFHDAHMVFFRCRSMRGIGWMERSTFDKRYIYNRQLDCGQYFYFELRERRQCQLTSDRNGVRYCASCCSDGCTRCDTCRDYRGRFDND